MSLISQVTSPPLTLSRALSWPLSELSLLVPPRRVARVGRELQRRALGRSPAAGRAVGCQSPPPAERAARAAVPEVPAAREVGGEGRFGGAGRIAVGLPGSGVTKREMEVAVRSFVGGEYPLAFLYGVTRN